MGAAAGPAWTHGSPPGASLPRCPACHHCGDPAAGSVSSRKVLGGTPSLPPAPWDILELLPVPETLKGITSELHSLALSYFLL